MSFSILFLVASFGGGVLGAALGGLPVFILCGFAAIIGAGITAATGDTTFSDVIAWGPLLGPQVSFAGAAAASVYAAKKGKLASGKDIVTALISLNSMDVLLVGGVFGVIGYLLQWGIANIPPISALGFTNAIAMSIVINAIIARLVFGKTGVFGKVREGDNRWRASEVAAWLPWLSSPSSLLVVGLGFGIVISYTTIMTPGMSGLWFGVATACLIFLQFGVNVPVWHHIALSAELAIASAGGDIWWGVTFAVLAAYLGDFYAMLFLAHGDSHIDPPSAALFTTFIIMSTVYLTGAFSSITGVGSLVVTVIVSAVGYGIMALLKKGKVSGADVTAPVEAA